MDLRGLVPGDRIELEDLSVAEVVEPSPDGETIRIRYLEAPFDPELVRTEAEVTYDLVAGVVSIDGATTDLGGESRQRDWVG